MRRGDHGRRKFDLFLAFCVGEVFLTNRAGVVRRVAVLGAGRLFGRRLRQFMRRGDHGRRKFDLFLAFCVGEILPASFTEIIFNIPLLRTGSFLCIDLGKAMNMPLILDDGILFVDFSLSVLIGKILSANITSIVCNVAVCRLGRVLCLDKGHRVTLSCNNGVLFINLRCALFIRIILSANGAGIVRRITFVGTRRVFCLDSAHGMSFRFHNGRIERNLLCPCLVRIVLSATITLVICGMTVFGAGCFYCRDRSHRMSMCLILFGRTGSQSGCHCPCRQNGKDVLPNFFHRILLC